METNKMRRFAFLAIMFAMMFVFVGVALSAVPLIRRSTT